jgi:DEAD/DEAH box helicase domain-containing protein
VVIIDVERGKSIAELDWRASHTMLHEQAIYQHDGECWQVERLDHENHKAFVRKVEPDYWTTALTYVDVSVIEESAVGRVALPPRGPLALVRPAWPSGWGEVAVVEKVVGYKKIKFYTHENAGYGDVRLPEMQMHTTAFWMTVPETVCAAVRAGRPAAIDGLRGIGVALETVATLALMCDPRDLGTTLGHCDDERDAHDGKPNVPRRERGGPAPGYSPTLFLYEHVPGGTGLAERIWEQRDALLERTMRMVAGCPCAAGCPACVGPSGESSQPARKRTALELLAYLSDAGIGPIGHDTSSGSLASGPA